MRRTKIIPKDLEDAGFFSKRVGSFSGIPQSTVQLWTEKKLLTSEKSDTSGTGDRRLYSPLNGIELGIIRKLSESRLSFGVITEVMDFLHRHEITQKRDLDGGGHEIWVDVPNTKSNLEKLFDEDHANLSIFFHDDHRITIMGTGGTKEKRDIWSGSKQSPMRFPEDKADYEHIYKEVTHTVVHLIPNILAGKDEPDTDNLYKRAKANSDWWIHLNLTRIAKRILNKML